MRPELIPHHHVPSLKALKFSGVHWLIGQCPSCGVHFCADHMHPTAIRARSGLFRSLLSLVRHPSDSRRSRFGSEAYSQSAQAEKMCRASAVIDDGIVGVGNAFEARVIIEGME